MTRHQLACFALTASAVVLAALVLVQLQDRLPRAYANQVVNRDNLTLMTAQTRSSEEGLFVLDNISERVLVYSTDAARRRLDLVGNLNLPETFASAFRDSGGNRRDRGAR